MITKIKTPSYCYRYSNYHKSFQHYHDCISLEEHPEIDAWNNIDDAFFFDIKLVDFATLHDYITVISRIKDISKNKYIWLHFSNDLGNPMSNDTEKLFWDLLDVFYDEQDFALELHRKVCRNEKEELTEFDNEFFQRVKDWTEKENLKYVTLAVERKSSSSIDFFRKQS